MTAANVVDRATWVEARLAHLDDEKELTRRREELSRSRRELPWLEVDGEYRFESKEGVFTLADLFDGRRQLLVYHFMFGPGWGEGCPSCSFWADGLDGTGVHLAARDTTLIAVSRGSLDEIESYRSRMGWSFPWYSSSGSDFNVDMGVSFSADDVADGSARYNFGTSPAHGEEMPGVSVFTRSDDDRVFLTTRRSLAGWTC